MQRFFINQLSKEIIDKFSISFLIKYPSCVLKELIENSLDANSSSIVIYIENYGAKLIKVVDDGIGIYKNDLNKIGLRFNTSKISKIDDLNCISTYGFRGESLYVIRSLSKLNIISKPYDQDFAYDINFNYSNSDYNVLKCPGINGTTVEVRDLFYNNSEFKNNSKKILEEKYDIFHVLSCMVLSRFDVRFVFYSNGVELYNFPRCNNMYSKFNRLSFFYPGLRIDDIINLNYSLDDLNLHGVIYFNSVKKKINKFKFFFVNNRIVNSDLIDKVFDDIFYNKSEKNNLSYCVYLYLDPSLYTIFFSINKMDIVFKNFDVIYKFLFDSMSKSINSNDLKCSDNFYKKNDLIHKIDIDPDPDKFFCMNNNVNKYFKNNNNIILIYNCLNVCFYLNNKLYFTYLPVIRNRVLVKLFSNQYLKYNRILNKKILYCELLSVEVFSIFLEFKNILNTYGLVFELFDDKFLILRQIPVLLYNFNINWSKLFLDLKFFFDKSIFSSFSFSRFDINIINIYIKNIYPKSKVCTYEVNFFYNELTFSSINDISWFNKNCNEVFLKKK